MDNLPRALVIIAIILGGAYIVRGLYPADRYVVVAAPGGGYRLDRLTGALLFCDTLLCRPLPVATFVPDNRPPSPVDPKKPAPKPVEGATGT